MAEPADPAVLRRPGKSASAFRTISEVAEELEVPQHVLRFWESKFPQVRPLKRGGGRRYYRPEDIVLLRRIRQCLYQEGYTIRGVQRLLREGALKIRAAVPNEQAPLPLAPANDTLAAPAEAASHEIRAALRELRDELVDLRDFLRDRLRR
jgi:DNA-binding transcriptional MerR regulator